MSETKETGSTVTCKVISSKMDKSATVMVERKVKHPVYGKYIRRSTKLHIHDEENACQEGDTVIIQQCRPLSETKSRRRLAVVERGE